MAAVPLDRHGMVMPGMPVCREFSIPSAQGRFQGIVQQTGNRIGHARPRGSTPQARPYLGFSTAGSTENPRVKSNNTLAKDPLSVLSDAAGLCAGFMKSPRNIFICPSALVLFE